MFDLQQKVFEDRQVHQPHRATSRSRERAIFEVNEQRLFLESNNHTKSEIADFSQDMIKTSGDANRVESENWADEENFAENGINIDCQQRLAKLLEIADSPIRKRVTFQALNPVYETEPGHSIKSKGEILQERLEARRDSASD